MPRPNVSRLADNDAGSYESAEAAAVAALGALRSGDKHVERGGGILYNAQTQKYAFTQPVGQLDDAHFSASIAVPQGWQLKSIYHSHPEGPQSTIFSGDDVAMAQQLKIPSYILAHYDNKIRVFDPATSAVTRSAGTSSSIGSLVDEPAPSPPTAATPSTVTPPTT